MGKSRISNNIRQLRFFNNEMTQQELAEKAGVTRQTIIAMEQEKYSPWNWLFASPSPLACHWKMYSLMNPMMILNKYAKQENQK